MEKMNEAVLQQDANAQSVSTDEYYMNEDAEKELPIGRIFRLFASSVVSDKNIVLTKTQLNAIECISKCKTGELGYNAEYCPNCKKYIIHPRSCNNRSCPNCQSVDERRWVELRKAEVIEGLPYYHVVVTVPSELYGIASLNRALFYGLLMKLSAETMTELCRSKEYGAFTPGVVAVLHTWSSKMLFHPHVHMILSGGGLTSDGKFKEAPFKGDNKFFIPESIVASLFRGKMIAALKEAYDNKNIHLNLPFSSECSLEDPRQWMNFCDKMYNMKWVSYVKETFNGNGNAIDYLGRYVYRTAISNSRILSILPPSKEYPEGQVNFKYKDYADGSKEKVETVTGKEFVLRFLNHVLPERFCRVRYSGILSNACKQKNLRCIAQIQKKEFLISVLKGKKKTEVVQFFFGNTGCSCPFCHGKLEPCGRITRKTVSSMKRVYKEYKEAG